MTHSASGSRTDSGLLDSGLFARRVRASGAVWGLQSGYRWAFRLSRERDTEVVLFWSEEALAWRHAAGEWEGHVATPIALDAFIRNWLPALRDDDVLIGLDFDGSLAAREIEPHELARELAAEG